MNVSETNLRSIFELDAELSQIQDFDILLERILREARKVVKADAGSIYILEKTEEDGEKIQRLSVRYAQNDTTEKQLPPGQKPVYSFFGVPLDEKTISGYCAYARILVNVHDAYNLPPNVPYSFNTSFDQRSGYKTTSSLAVPLITPDGKLLGVIQVFNAMDKNNNVVSFSKDDELLISNFAIKATQALERASITRATLLRMIRMAELRDPKETGAHVNRVGGYVIEIYDRWAHNHEINSKIHEQFRDIIKVAALLHDVGKVAISDTILKKPAKFTPEEYLIMQQHTSSGAALFDDPLSPFDVVAYDIALTHHENWDGTGYPGWVDPVTQKIIKQGEDGKALGKKGEEIPLSGRIVALADVYDALCSKRVYKQAWAEEDVLEEIKGLSGTKFDPELVDIFFEIYPRIKHIQRMYPELE